MAGDALFVSGGVTDAREARLASSGLLAVTGPTALDIRTGVLHGPGSTALLTGTSKTGPKMSVLIGVHVGVGSRGTANGAYLGPTLDAPLEVDVDLAPASGSRIDVVWERQRDSTPGVPTPDAATGPEYGVLKGTSTTGTPAKPDLAALGPVGATELGTVLIASGATSTNGAGVTITNTARLTVARGAPIPVRNQAERTALATAWGATGGLTVKRLDVTGTPMEEWDGTTWRRYQQVDDTGWVNLSLAAGWSGASQPGVRRINGIVYFRGEVWGNVSTIDVNLLTDPLAAEWRPPTRIRFMLTSIGGTSGISGSALSAAIINTDGTIALASQRNASPGYMLGSISYPAG